MFKMFMSMRQLGPTLPAAFTGPPAPPSQMQPTQSRASDPMVDAADQGGEGGYDWNDQPTWAQVNAMLAPTQMDSVQDGADGVPSSVQQTLSIQQGTHPSDGLGPQQPATRYHSGQQPTVPTIQPAVPTPQQPTPSDPHPNARLIPVAGHTGHVDAVAPVATPITLITPITQPVTQATTISLGVSAPSDSPTAGPSTASAAVPSAALADTAVLRPTLPADPLVALLEKQGQILERLTDPSRSTSVKPVVPKPRNSTNSRPTSAPSFASLTRIFR